MTANMKSNPKAPNMVVVLDWLLLVNHALDGAKILDMARYGDGSLLVKAKLFLSFLQQLHEERVVDVNHRDHKPLLLFTLTHHDCQTPLWDVFQFFIAVMVMVVVVMDLVVVKVKVWHVDMEIQLVFVSTNPHFEQNPDSQNPTLYKENTASSSFLFFVFKRVIRKQRRKAKDQRQRWQG